MKLLRLLLLPLVFGAGCQRGADPAASSGTVETDVIRIGSRAGGRISKLNANEGDTVHAGQVIVELEAPELEAQRREASAELADLEAGARPEELAAATAELATLKAEAQLAGSDASRVRQLATGGAATAQEVDRNEARAKTAQTAVAASQSRLDLLKAGARRDRMEQVRARIQELDAHLAELRVLSPTNAVIESLAVKVGDVVAPNREVATLLPPDTLWVRVYVPQPWLGFLHPGDPVEIRADASPQQVVEGHVEQIAREAEFTPRNVQTPGERVQQVFAIKVRLPPQPLRPGMSIDARFPGVPKEIVAKYHRL